MRILKKGDDLLSHFVPKTRQYSIDFISKKIFIITDGDFKERRRSTLPSRSKKRDSTNYNNNAITHFLRYYQTS